MTHAPLRRLVEGEGGRPEPQRLRCYVADTNALTRFLVADALARDARIEVVGRATHEIRRSDISLHSPDVLFVEARMTPEAVEACLAWESVLPRAVVLVSSVASDACLAFEIDAMDFLLRPFSASRVDAAVRRVLRQLALRSLSGAHGATVSDSPELRSERFAIATRGGTSYVSPSVIEAIVGADGGTLIVTEASRIMSTEALPDLEQRLPAGQFLRTHRSAIVNLDAVVRLESNGSSNDTLVTKSQMRVPVARRRLPSIRAALRTGLAFNDGKTARPNSER